MHSKKAKCFIITLIILALYTLASFVFFEDYFVKKPTPKTFHTSFYWRDKVVHLDLKGPPKMSYLMFLLPFMQSLGVTGILMEYEDMFPYKGSLVNISSKNCYTKKELRLFIHKAVSLGIEIIPYIQTLGQMEHVLELDEYKNLSEIASADTICPSKDESKALISNMIEQITQFHSKIFNLRYIHVGGGDTQHIGQCDKCKDIPKKEIIFKHITFLSNKMKTLNPEISLLIWDDMIPDLNTISGDKYVFYNVEPVLRDVNNPNISKKMLAFNQEYWIEKIWIASPFKGADGEASSLPKLRRRLNNLLIWMKKCYDFKYNSNINQNKITGVILTGPSRYNHKAPLCDLLPASIPSLVLNLMIINKFNKGFTFVDKNEVFNVDNFYKNYIANEVNSTLLYKTDKVLELDDIGGSYCYFVGSVLYNMLNSSYINEDAKKLEEIINIINNNKYYAKKDGINARNATDDVNWFNETLIELNEFENAIYNEMKVYYNNDTIDEFVKYKFNKLKTQLNLNNSTNMNEKSGVTK